MFYYHILIYANVRYIDSQLSTSLEPWQYSLWRPYWLTYSWGTKSNLCQHAERWWWYIKFHISPFGHPMKVRVHRSATLRSPFSEPIREFSPLSHSEETSHHPQRSLEGHCHGFSKSKKRSKEVIPKWHGLWFWTHRDRHGIRPFSLHSSLRDINQALQLTHSGTPILTPS